MDSKKQEASISKELAEVKFLERDFVRAKSYALRAHNLYPELDGLAQFIAAINVYISAEKDTDGLVKWYKVLGVNPSADDATIKKQFKKLALSLHPDKNKSIGAEGAFDIVSKAHALLSDKHSRMAYDQELKVSRSRFVNGWTPYAHNGLHDSLNKKRHPASHLVPDKTFWTLCLACRTQFEYQLNYMNKILRCSRCHVSFKAVKTQAPWEYAKAQQPTSANHSMHHQSVHQDTKYWSKFSAVNLSGQASCPSNGVRQVPAHATSKGTGVSQVPSKKVNEETNRTAAQRTKTRIFDRNGEWLPDSGSSSSSVSVDRPMKRSLVGENENSKRATALPPRKGHSESENVNITGEPKSGAAKEISNPEIRNMLVTMAQNAIRQKLKTFAATTEASGTQVRKKEKKGKETTCINEVKVDAVRKNTKIVNVKQKIEIKESCPADVQGDPDTKDIEAVTMTVPDPDFYDFDQDRTQRSFREKEVWAVYDDEDGMPRLYVKIHSVESLKPFRVRISWLTSKTNSELSPINWIGSGFTKTCGDFRIGKQEVWNHLNSFSHKVKWTKGTKGIIQIYPKKGDTWALYRNWSPEWNVFTPTEVIQKYDLVEVLDDFNESSGLVFAPLVKVAGFKTVFRRNTDQNKIRTVLREEIFRFSHQVKSIILTGKEGLKAPRGCLELDSAALPMELLQVLTEAQLREMELVTEQSMVNSGLSSKRKSMEDKQPDNGITSNGESHAAAVERDEKPLLFYKRRRLGKKESSAEQET